MHRDIPLSKYPACAKRCEGRADTGSPRYWRVSQAGGNKQKVGDRQGHCYAVPKAALYLQVADHLRSDLTLCQPAVDWWQAGWLGEPANSNITNKVPQLGSSLAPELQASGFAASSQPPHCAVIARLTRNVVGLALPSRKQIAGQARNDAVGRSFQLAATHLRETAFPPGDGGPSPKHEARGAIALAFRCGCALTGATQG